MHLRLLSAICLAIALLALSACKPVGTPAQQPTTSTRPSPTQADILEGAKPRQDGDPARSLEEKIRRQFDGNATVVVRPSTVAGMTELSINDQVYYVDSSNRYLVHGEVLDLDTGNNLTQQSIKRTRAELLASLDEKDAIHFGPAKSRDHLIVFTDVECGFCRKFHEQIGDYVRQGISVSYYPWPRSGLQGPVHDEMVGVWCAKNRAKALTDAKQGHAPSQPACERGRKIVEKSFLLGQRMGIMGTPAVFLEDGSQIGGYIGPDQIQSALTAARAVH